MFFLRHKKYILSLIVLAIASLVFYFSTLENFQEEVIEDPVMIVNGVLVSKSDFLKYEREVFRNNFEENLSDEELKEEAQRRAIYYIVTQEYFDEKGVNLTPNEIENAIIEYVIREPNAETKEEYFNIMETRGYSKEERMRDITLFLRTRKLIDTMIKDIDVDEEDIIARYKEYEESGREGYTLRSFEDARASIEREIASDTAMSIIVQELNERGEQAKIQYLD